jgi:replicative DNA helicase
MIRENRCIGDVVLILKPEDFYHDAHQKIFKLIVQAWDKAKPVDLQLLADRLYQTNQLEDCGGYPYIADLFDCAPTSANVEHYAREVRNRALQRRLLVAGQEIVTDAYSPAGEVDEMIERAEKQILAVADSGTENSVVSLKEAIQGAMERLDDRHAQLSSGIPIRGVPSGFVDLDELTCGFQNGELIVIAARPSVGKTAYAVNILHHCGVNMGLPTLFVSLEQSKHEIAERFIVLHSRVDSDKIRKCRLSSDDMQKIVDAGDAMNKSPVRIDDVSCQSMMRIAATARRMKARNGLAIVLIDYLQLIEPDDRRAPRQEQVSTTSRRLKHLARELNVPVIALAQLNRQAETSADKRPKLSHLRESGAIEQDADVVMLLHRPEEEEAANGNTQTIEVDVAKQRNGPTDKIVLNFRRPIMRFENYGHGEGPTGQTVPWNQYK